MISTERMMNRWTDDHLDLLNYAKQIGDIDWQNNIISLLAQSKEQTTQFVISLQVEELWRHFDSINTKILELYNQLRKLDNEYEIQALKEEVWGLKLKRVALGKQFKTTIQNK